MISLLETDDPIDLGNTPATEARIVRVRDFIANDMAAPHARRTVSYSSSSRRARQFPT